MVTTYFLNNIMGNVFGSKTNPSLPTKYYIGLSTTAPAIDGTGVSEPDVSTGYQRIEITVFGEPVEGVITNDQPISFNESTADQGTMTHFVIYDAVIGGNLLMYDELTAPRTIESATIVTIKEADLKLTLANSI